jgi:cytochrome c2
MKGICSSPQRNNRGSSRLNSLFIFTLKGEMKMNNIAKIFAAVAVLGMLGTPALASDSPNGAKIFNKKCKMCHSVDKKKTGPSVKAMNTDAEMLRSVIANGKKMMPKYKKKLSAEEIDAVVAFLKEQQG